MRQSGYNSISREIGVAPWVITWVYMMEMDACSQLHLWDGQYRYTGELVHRGTAMVDTSTCNGWHNSPL
jgi:hypothetical protein